MWKDSTCCRTPLFLEFACGKCNPLICQLHVHMSKHVAHPLSVPVLLSRSRTCTSIEVTEKTTWRLSGHWPLAFTLATPSLVPASPWRTRVQMRFLTTWNEESAQHDTMMIQYDTCTCMSFHPEYPWIWCNSKPSPTSGMTWNESKFTLPGSKDVKKDSLLYWAKPTLI